MNPRHRWIGFAVLAALALGSIVLVSCSSTTRSVMRAPEIEGASFAGNKGCLDCHQNYVRIFAASPHARVHVGDLAMPGQSGCESCHGPGSKHIAAGGGRGVFIINPGKDAASCFQCHLETHAQFSLPQHHPVLENRMNCVQCHDPHGREILKPAGGLAMARLNGQCASCHREQTRPFVFEHEALREGCTVCHTPHGSINAKMLIERDNNLCLKCHAQVAGASGSTPNLFIGKQAHTAFLPRGACWSSGCHTAVHGSNLSPLMRY
jgi:predicted CXXCH cytochrome family protein